MAFNPITLDYEKSIQGEVLKDRDHQAKYRAYLRAENIDRNFNARYNILTGEDRAVIQKINRFNSHSGI
jgi:hypothetical protein